MTDLFTLSVFFLLAGLGVLIAGVYVLARGQSTRRRLSFIQLSLAAGLWLVVFGTLVADGRAPGDFRASADLFLFLGLLAATTAYQFVTYGLDFGTEQPGGGERRRGVVAMWGIAAGVSVFLASGAIQMVESVELAGGVPVLNLHWHASPALAAIATGLVGAVLAAAKTWRGTPVVRRSRQAGLTAAGILGLLLAATAFLVPLIGSAGTALGGLAALAGAGALAFVASQESAPRHEVALPVRAALTTLRSPAVAAGREGAIYDANDAFLEAFGYKRRGLLGRELSELVSEQAGDEFPLAALGLESRHGSRDVMVRSADGRSVRSEAYAVQMGHLDGEALPALFLFHAPSLGVAGSGGRGPLDRWLTEIFRPEVPAIAMYDLEAGSFAGANDQLLQLIGHTRQEAMGRSASELGLPSDAHRWSSFLERVRDERRSDLTEINLTRGDGEKRHVECCGVMLPSEGDRKGLLLFRDITAIREAEKKLRGQALYDPLTGLPMPALFEEQLKHAIDRAQRYRKRVAVLLVDIEDLKPIRDEYGEAAGEKVVNGVAWRLYECFRQMDTLCRRGDDQFMVLLEELDEPKGAATAADRFRGFMEEPFELDSGESIRVRATVGIAVSVPGQTEADDLIEWADVAMFRAKRRGESPIRIYDPERDAGDMERLTRADRLRQAIDRDELALRYQPLIDLMDRRIIGAEALVRWPQATGEVLTPAEFLPLAEETGLIIPLSDWVFETAIGQAHAWQEFDPEFELSVNVAAQHFREPSLAATWERLLSSVPVPPETIQLEITESFALRDDRAIHRLRDLGLRVAVDDFGTGYSSLAYLRDLAVDVVKIDRAFVMDVDEDLRDQAIVQAVLLMAEAFDLEVTAEGIETEPQLRWLTDAGCHVGQGFYFGHPLVPEDFEALLRRGLVEREFGIENSPRSDEPREVDLSEIGVDDSRFGNYASGGEKTPGQSDAREEGRKWSGEGWMGG